MAFTRWNTLDAQSDSLEPGGSGLEQPKNGLDGFDKDFGKTRSGTLLWEGAAAAAPWERPGGRLEEVPGALRVLALGQPEDQAGEVPHVDPGTGERNGMAPGPRPGWWDSVGSRNQGSHGTTTAYIWSNIA